MTHRYEIVDHTADTGIETGGATLADAIGNAAFGMFDLMYNLSSISAETSVTFEVTAVSPPELLVDVLSDLLLRSETDDLVFTNFHVRTAGTHAIIDVVGASIHGLELRGPPIKAVTYHELRCEPAGGGWQTRVIFDV
ncbi:MAG: archease [Actinomycetota bacterium]|nr:archease [Actinomycetota bacterium]